ncbi:efflux RND transporter periplasmic adaptor subunit [Limibacter armeniacum]|uniref:efflux RND transporter periplasmic adaptor subunit n=1 Tax=Limibacter armeniacum TaxID=466084 RepID=UPI002FE58B89
MKKKQFMSVGAGVLILLVAVAFLKLMPEQAKAKAEIKEKKAPLVEVIHPVAQEVDNIIKATGKLTAKERFEIYAQVDGALEASAKVFKEGKYYRKGAVVLSIDKQENLMSLLAQKSNFLSSVTAIIPDLKSDFPESYPQWKKYLEELNLNNSLKALPEPATEKEKYFIAGKGIYNSYYSIQSAEEQLRKFVIRAPFSGVVTQSMVAVGKAVRPGTQLGEMINTSAYELELTVPLKDVAYLKAGDVVALSSVDIEGQWDGKIARIGGNIDASSQSVKVFVATSGKELKEGMFLEAEITADKFEGAVTLPRKLLTGSKVFVVVNDKLKLQPVEVLAEKENIAIVKGLPANSAVLSTVMKSAFEGMSVQVKK